MKTTISTTTCVLSRFSIATFAVALSGCPDEEEGMGTGGDTGDQSMCSYCNDMQRTNAKCYCGGAGADATPPQSCWLSESACQTSCQNQGFTFVDWTPVACLSNDPVGSCSGWSPSSEVTFTAGVYYIDEDFVDDLDDGFGSAPLWTCDNAGFASTSGGFKVINASSGELLYQVGLRNNDVVQTINGIDVTTWAGADAAYDSYRSGATNFLVVVKRGSNNINLSWSLVP